MRWDVVLFASVEFNVMTHKTKRPVGWFGQDFRRQGSSGIVPRKDITIADLAWNRLWKSAVYFQNGFSITRELHVASSRRRIQEVYAFRMGVFPMVHHRIASSSARTHVDQRSCACDDIISPDRGPTRVAVGGRSNRTQHQVFSPLRPRFHPCQTISFVTSSSFWLPS
jgi:hypothetical protein